MTGRPRGARGWRTHSHRFRALWQGQRQLHNRLQQHLTPWADDRLRWHHDQLLGCYLPD